MNIIQFYSIVGASYYSYQNEVEKGLIVMSTGVYAEVMETIADLCEKIGGPYGKVWLGGLKKFLRRQNFWEVPRIFKIVKIGTFKDHVSLWKAMWKSGAEVDFWACDIINNIKLSKSEQSLSLVIRSVEELGLSKGATCSDICKGGEFHGLDLCPFEVAPQLRLQYPNQPDGEKLYIAVKSVDTYTFGHIHYVFYVSNLLGKRFLGWIGYSGHSFDISDRFVFVLRK